MNASILDKNSGIYPKASVIRVTPEVRKAVKAAAALNGEDMKDLADRILREALKRSRNVFCETATD